MNPITRKLVDSKKVKLNSLLFAMYIFETLICRMIDSVISIPYISVWLMLIILALTLVNNKRLSVSNLKSVSLWYAAINVILLISVAMNGWQYVGQYYIYFLVFGTTALLLAIVEVDFRAVMRDLLLLSMIYFLVYFLLERQNYLVSTDYWNVQMGLAYGFLIPVVVGMISLSHKSDFCFDKKDTLMAWICVAVGAFVIFFDCGTRGAMVSMLIALIFLIIEKEKSVKKIILIVCIGVLGIVFMTNLNEVLTLVYQLLSSYGIEMPALTKMIWMVEQGIADNGRNEIYDTALKLISEQAFLGGGVGYFESMVGGYYIHNLFLELMCEFGIFGTIIVLYIILKNVLGVFFMDRMVVEDKTISALLFLISIPLLIFSSTYWVLPSFWLYFWRLQLCHKNSVNTRRVTYDKKIEIV